MFSKLPFQALAIFRALLIPFIEETVCCTLLQCILFTVFQKFFESSKSKECSQRSALICSLCYLAYLKAARVRCISENTCPLFGLFAAHHSIKVLRASICLSCTKSFQPATVISLLLDILCGITSAVADYT